MVASQDMSELHSNPRQRAWQRDASSMCWVVAPSSFAQEDWVADTELHGNFAESVLGHGHLLGIQLVRSDHDCGSLFQRSLCSLLDLAGIFRLDGNLSAQRSCSVKGFHILLGMAHGTYFCVSNGSRLHGRTFLQKVYALIQYRGIMCDCDHRNGE